MGGTIRGGGAVRRYDPVTHSDEVTTGGRVAVAVTEEIRIPRRPVMSCPPGRLVARTECAAGTVVRVRRAFTVVVLLALVGVGVLVLPIGAGVASAGDYEVTAGTVAVTYPDGAARGGGAGTSGPLADGATVRTDTGGGAALGLGRAVVVRLGPATGVRVGTDTDDDPAATRTRRVALDSGRVWARHALASDAVPLVVASHGVALRLDDAAADIACDAAGCVVVVASGGVVATSGWDRFQVHAGERVRFGASGDVGRLEAVTSAELAADAWVASNAASDAADAKGSGDIGAGDEPGLADAQIEGTWQVSTSVTASETSVRPVGPEPKRSWGVSRDCDYGECRLGVVDTADGSTVVGSGRSVGPSQHVDGVTRTFDCVSTGTGDVTATDAIAETRTSDVRAVAAVRSGGRWLASDLAGSGTGDLRWAGRGRTCRGVRPGAFAFDVEAVRLDLAS